MNIMLISLKIGASKYVINIFFKLKNNKNKLNEGEKLK